MILGIVSFHSCKKDKELDEIENRVAETSKFNPNEIKDMDKYLMDFMKKIKSSTRDGESMTIEDAEWHLSACLNFQFCNANVDKSCVSYDTIFSTINVNNGNVSMNDINTSLQVITEDIAEIYNASNLENKNLLFIMPEIMDETLRGETSVRTVVAISGNNDMIGNYYFEYDSIPLSLFPENSEYSWRTEAIDTLMYFINVFQPTFENTDRVYSVTTMTKECMYDEYPGRLFFEYYNYIKDYKLHQQQMAFCLDSYLGLINTLRPDYLIYISSAIVPWCGSSPSNSDNKDMNYIHHELKINYGYGVCTGVPPIDMER